MARVICTGGSGGFSNADGGMGGRSNDSVTGDNNNHCCTCNSVVVTVIVGEMVVVGW